MNRHQGNPPKTPFSKGGLGQTKLFTDRFLVEMVRFFALFRMTNNADSLITTQPLKGMAGVGMG